MRARAHCGSGTHATEPKGAARAVHASKPIRPSSVTSPVSTPRHAYKRPWPGCILAAERSLQDFGVEGQRVVPELVGLLLGHSLGSPPPSPSPLASDVPVAETPSKPDSVLVAPPSPQPYAHDATRIKLPRKILPVIASMRPGARRESNCAWPTLPHPAKLQGSTRTNPSAGGREHRVQSR